MKLLTENQKKCVHLNYLLRNSSIQSLPKNFDYLKEIESVLSLDSSLLAFSYDPILYKKNNEDNKFKEEVTCLAMFILDLIKKEILTNQDFFHLIQKYNISPHLGKCFSHRNSHLLDAAIHFDNIEFFTYLCDKHLEQFDINWQDNNNETMFHHFQGKSPENSLLYFKKLIFNPVLNININLKNNQNQAVFDTFSAHQKKLFLELTQIKNEENLLSKKLVNQISNKKNKKSIKL